MSFTLTGTNLDAPSPVRWPASTSDSSAGPRQRTTRLGGAPPLGGGRTLNFQAEPRYVRSVWPTGPVDP